LALKSFLYKAPLLLFKANIEDSVGMLKLLQRRFGAIINTHPTLKNICLWEDYCCTGQELGRGAYSTVYLGRHVKTAKALGSALSLLSEPETHPFLALRLLPSRQWIGTD